ncbi:hypothetical protein GQ42DRAFT_165970 [Ramicandelaber brevisporus]|nr:hypothetical protein GQ42DRAFT_165970 [Ramicandelaber brevisporus]
MVKLTRVALAAAALVAATTSVNGFRLTVSTGAACAKKLTDATIHFVHHWAMGDVSMTKELCLALANAGLGDECATLSQQFCDGFCGLVVDNKVSAPVPCSDGQKCVQYVDTVTPGVRYSFVKGNDMVWAAGKGLSNNYTIVFTNEAPHPDDAKFVILGGATRSTKA